MSIIACICPRELVIVADAAAKDYGEPVTIRAGSMSQGVHVARQLLEQGVEAIWRNGDGADRRAFPHPRGGTAGQCV